MPVQGVMIEGVRTISPTTAAEDAWTILLLNRIHHLVVTKGMQVFGVLADRGPGVVLPPSRPSPAATIVSIPWGRS